MSELRRSAPAECETAALTPTDSTTPTDQQPRPELPALPTSAESDRQPPEAVAQRDDADADADDDLMAQRSAAAEEQLVPRVGSSRRRTLLRVWQRICVLALSYLVPSAVVLANVLAVDWRASCAAPLRVWGLGQVLLQLLAAAAMGLVLWRVRRALLPRHLRTRWRSPLGRAVERMLRSVWLKLAAAWLLTVSWLAWLLLGLIWTFEMLGAPKRECQATHLFRVAFGTCVVQLVLLGMLLLCCCCSCLVLVLRIWVAPPLPRAPRGASKEELERLPSMPYVVGDPAVPADRAMCAICLSDYEPGDELRPLPCRHHFHRACIDQWLRTNKSCPFCKHVIDQPPPPLSSSAAAVAADALSSTSPATAAPAAGAASAEASAPVGASVSTTGEPLPSSARVTAEQAGVAAVQHV